MEPLRKLKKKELLEVKVENIRDLNKDDFFKAIDNVPPSLTAKDIKIYKDFEKKFAKDF